MSISQTSLSPADNAELLRALARIRRAKKGTSEWTRAKRDGARTLAESKLFVTLDLDGSPALRPEGPDRQPVISAFTDDEAAEAWVEQLHPAFPEPTLISSSELFGSDAPGRKVWSAWLERHDDAILSLNPAGPLHCLIYANELRQARPGLRHRNPPVPGGEDWLDVSARMAIRARMRELIPKLAAADSEEKLAPLRVQVSEINPFGSSFWLAELSLMSGRAHLAEGQLQAGVSNLIDGSLARAYGADPYTAIDGLVEAGRAAARALERVDLSSDDRQQLDARLRQIAILLGDLRRIGYRDEDAAPFRDANA